MNICFDSGLEDSSASIHAKAAEFLSIRYLVLRPKETILPELALKKIQFQVRIGQLNQMT